MAMSRSKQDALLDELLWGGTDPKDMMGERV